MLLNYLLHFKTNILVIFKTSTYTFKTLSKLETISKDQTFVYVFKNEYYFKVKKKKKNPKMLCLSG